VPALVTVSITSSQLSAVRVSGEGSASGGSGGNSVVGLASVTMCVIGRGIKITVGDRSSDTSGVTDGADDGTRSSVSLRAKSASLGDTSAGSSEAQSLIAVGRCGIACGGVGGGITASDSNAGSSVIVDNVEPCLIVTHTSIINVLGCGIDTTVVLDISDCVGNLGSTSICDELSGANRSTLTPVEA